MTPVELVNLALLKIGISKGVAALTEADSKEGYTSNLVYDHMLRACLREFPWPFATKYLDLTLTRGPVWDTDVADILVQAWSGAATAIYEKNDVVLSGGIHYWARIEHTNQIPPNATYWTTTAQEYANRDWLYGYRWPTDCIFARRLTDDGVGRTFDPNPIPWRIGRDKQGLILYSNEPEANLEYTMIDCDTLWTNDLFLDAFTWRLAAMLAPSLSEIKGMAAECMQMYRIVGDMATMVDSQEQQQEKDGEAEWIRGRE